MSSRRSRSSDLATQFPGLAHLAGAYLGQMYEYVDGSAQEAVRSFSVSEASHVASAAEGITFLLSEFPDEQARMKALRAINWAYSPGAGGLDEFLRWTRDTLSNRAPSESAAG